MNLGSLEMNLDFKFFRCIDYKRFARCDTQQKKHHSLVVVVFRMSNRGCPFIPGFRYLLERYFVMSPMPDTCVACLSMRVLPARSEILLPAWSVWPIISQKMLVGLHTACIWLPFFVHRKLPRSESIDFSHEGSFSTSHLGILLSLCTILICVLSINLLFASGQVTRNYIPTQQPSQSFEK